MLTRVCSIRAYQRLGWQQAGNLADRQLHRWYFRLHQHHDIITWLDHHHNHQGAFDPETGSVRYICRLHCGASLASAKVEMMMMMVMVMNMIWWWTWWWWWWWWWWYRHCGAHTLHQEDQDLMNKRRRVIPRVVKSMKKHHHHHLHIVDVIEYKYWKDPISRVVKSTRKKHYHHCHRLIF